MERRPFSPARVLRALLGPNPPQLPDPMLLAIKATAPVIPTARRDRRRAARFTPWRERQFAECMDIPRSRR